MAAPTMTHNATGNIANAAAIAASGNATYALDYSTKFGAYLDVVYTTGAAVVAGNGLRCEVFGGYGAGPTYDSLAAILYQFASQAVSLTASNRIFVPTGKWQLKLTNLDPTNGITVTVTSATIDSVA